MNLNMLISSLVMYGLTGLCFFLPYKGGQKSIGLTVSLILGFLLTLTLIGNLDFFLVVIWLVILCFQIVFLIYWVFRLWGRKKAGTVITTIIIFFLLFIVLEPWISDWTFSKKNAKNILSQHGFYLKDDFKIIKNESGGLRDYYHIFTIEISDSDYQSIADKIRSAKSYKGVLTDLAKQLPRDIYKTKDTLNFESNYHIEREFYTKKRMDDGTFHFRFRLSKTNKELQYIGSNE